MGKQRVRKPGSSFQFSNRMDLFASSLLIIPRKFSSAQNRKGEGMMRIFIISQTDLQPKVVQWIAEKRGNEMKDWKTGEEKTPTAKTRVEL